MLFVYTSIVSASTQNAQCDVMVVRLSVVEGFGSYHFSFSRHTLSGVERVETFSAT